MLAKNWGLKNGKWHDLRSHRPLRRQVISPREHAGDLRAQLPSGGSALLRPRPEERRRRRRVSKDARRAREPSLVRPSPAWRAPRDEVAEAASPLWPALRVSPPEDAVDWRGQPWLKKISTIWKANHHMNYGRRARPICRALPADTARGALSHARTTRHLPLRRALGDEEDRRYGRGRGHRRRPPKSLGPDRRRRGAALRRFHLEPRHSGGMAGAAPWYFDVVHGPIKMADGFRQVPDQSGLGVRSTRRRARLTLTPPRHRTR